MSLHFRSEGDFTQKWGLPCAAAFPVLSGPWVVLPVDPWFFCHLRRLERTVQEDGWGVGRSVEGKGSAGQPLQRRRDGELRLL